jgi:hypothetical protein
LILGGKERGEREEHNPSKTRRNRGRIEAESEVEGGGSGSVDGGGRRLKMALTCGPHMSAAGERRGGGSAWAGSAARREKEYWAKIGPIT